MDFLCELSLAREFIGMQIQMVLWGIWFSVQGLGIQ